MDSIGGEIKGKHQIIETKNISWDLKHGPSDRELFTRERNTVARIEE